MHVRGGRIIKEEFVILLIVFAVLGATTFGQTTANGSVLQARRSISKRITAMQ
jgi:hypothetical protein